MIETIKNVSNILFFCIVPLIAVLSYIQARKTLFAPIRTETFKLQLKTFEEILLFFQNKTESDYLNAFDLDRIMSLNALEMADNYVTNFFPDEIKIDKESRAEIYKPLIGAIVSMKHAEQFFQQIDSSNPSPRTSEEDNKITNPAIILAKWKKYEHGAIRFTKDFQNQIDELQRIAASPLIPKNLRALILEFKKVGEENLSLIGTTISELAQLMPEHFPNAKDMQKFSHHWIWNEYNRKRGNFEPIANKILSYFNEYLKVDEILK